MSDGLRFVVCGPIHHSGYSNGILALARLCRAVREAGRRAVVCVTDCRPNEERLLTVKDPGWGLAVEAARREDVELMEPGTALPAEAMVVYPETMGGNVLEARRVIRWYGNKPEALKSCETGAGEFILAQSRVVYPGAQHVCFFAWRDPAFHDGGTAPAISRPLDVTYNGKGNLYGETRRVAGTLRITRSWPGTKEELAMVLRTCRFFFTADAWSAINAEALCCGAIPVFIHPGPWTDAEVDGSEVGRLPRLVPGAELTEAGFAAFETERRAFVARLDAVTAGWHDSVRAMLVAADAHFAEMGA